MNSDSETLAESRRKWRMGEWPDCTCHQAHTEDCLNKQRNFTADQQRMLANYPFRIWETDGKIWIAYNENRGTRWKTSSDVVPESISGPLLELMDKLRESVRQCWQILP